MTINKNHDHATRRSAQTESTPNGQVRLTGCFFLNQDFSS